MDNIEVLQDLNRYANYGYRSSYKEDTWDILKKDIKLASDEVGQLENKMNDALRAGAIAKYSEAWWSMLTAINEAKLAVFEYQEALLDAIEDHRDVFKEINESQQEYQRNRGSFGGERHYANEEVMHSSNLINQLTEALNDNIRKNGLSFIGSDAYYEQITRLSDAFNDETEAYKNIIELDQDYYERLIKHNDAYYDNAEAIMEGAEAFGEYEDTEKYRNEILKLTEDLGFASKEAERMEADLNAAVASGAIKKGSTEWLEQRIEIEKVRGEVIDYQNNIEEANQKIRELEYEELFDRVIDKMDQFVDKLETINGLIHDEMMYDYDTGKLTETGALALILNNNALDTSIAKLNKYAQERQRIMDDYANGLFGKETFNKLMDDVTSNINSTLGEIDKSRNNILTIIKDQTKAELDVLDKVIEKRKEAIFKQREYWTYGNQLSDKNKEIQLLQQQIESLSGVANAESRAKKQRLESQLADAQRDLDETVQNHVYEMQVEGLDDLKKKLDEDYEKYINEISKSTQNITTAIDTAVQTSGQDIGGGVQTLNDTLGGMGADIVNEMYTDTVTGREFEDRVTSSNTDRVVAAIKDASDKISETYSEQKEYENGKMAQSVNHMVGDAGKKAIAEDKANKYKGTFTIAAAKNTGYVLDISGGSTKKGANTQLYKSNGTAAQQFTFDANPDGTYTIRNIKSGLVLDVTGASTKNGANVQQWKANGTKAQKWTIVENSDGSVSFKNLASGKMLDISGDEMANKTNIRSWKGNGTTGQKFYLKKLAKGSKYINKDGTYLTQEDGAEILSTKYGLLTPLAKGDGVLPAEMTAKLYDIAANYDKFDASGFKLPATIEGTTNNRNSVNYNVGDINISGSTNLTRKDLEQFRSQIVEDVKNAIAADMRKFGYKPALA